MTGALGGPAWWPLVPMLLVTPLVSFALNRAWVFGRLSPAPRGSAPPESRLVTAATRP